jgi:SAM-dependent methyltransferase
MILDIGCGNAPRGHVNMDLFMNATTPDLKNKERQYAFIDPKKIPNPVKADAQYLPFRDNSFTVVFSSHVLEHLRDPFKALLDMLRVSKRKVVFRIPHRYRFGHRTAVKEGRHKHTFSVRSTIQFLERLQCPYSLNVVSRGFPSDYLSLINVPQEIRVTLLKIESPMSIHARELSSLAAYAPRKNP